MQSEKSTNKKADLSPSMLYDMCAPAVYGSIFSIVRFTPIADKLLEKVFVCALQPHSQFTQSLQPPLVALVNIARIKSEKTVAALKIFNECCAGMSVSIEKKVLTDSIM